MSESTRPPRKGLGLRLYVLLSRPRPNAGNREHLREEHWNYIQDLEARGILFAAGPEVDENDVSQGPGIIVIRAPSLAAAKAIADAEPFHRDEFRDYEIRTWRVTEGGFGLRVRFTEKTMSIE